MDPVSSRYLQIQWLLNFLLLFRSLVLVFLRSLSSVLWSAKWRQTKTKKQPRVLLTDPLFTIRCSLCPRADNDFCYLYTYMLAFLRHCVSARLPILTPFFFTVYHDSGIFMTEFLQVPRSLILDQDSAPSFIPHSSLAHPTDRTYPLSFLSGTYTYV